MSRQLLQPRQAVVVPCRMQDDKYFDTLLHRLAHVYPHPRLAPELTLFDSYFMPHEHMVPILVRNKTDRHIQIVPEQIIAEMSSLLPSDFLHGMASFKEADISPEERQAQDERSLIAFDKILDKGGVTDPEERIELRKAYVRDGCVDLPVPPDSHKGLTVIESKETEPMTDDEVVQSVEVGHLTPPQQKMVRDMVRRHLSVFQRHKHHYRRSDKIEATVEVKPIPAPMRQPQIPIPPQLLGKVDRLFDGLKKAGIVAHCIDVAPIIASMLVIPKANGKDIRLLLDLRNLNALTLRRQTESLRIDQVQAAFSKATFVTTLDLSNAFFSIPIKEEHQRYFAFVGPRGQIFNLTAAPQGWCNSSMYLNQLLERAIGDVKDTYFYADDVFDVDGHTFESHLASVETVLARLDDYGLLIKPSKFSVASKHVIYLGMVFDLAKDGARTISIPEARLQGYKAMEKPETRKKLLSFLCSVSYFRRFIPRFAQMSYKLHQEALPNRTRFEWTEELDQEYNNLLDHIAKHATITCPDPNKDFVCFSDASNTAASFMVFQKCDKTKQLKLCACLSRTFSKTERSAHIYAKELHAVCYGLESYQFWLRYAPSVTVYSDARGIMLTRIARNSTPSLLRKLCFLTNFPLTIRHIRGKDNLCSDFLSRYHNRAPAHVSDTSKYLSQKDAEKLLQAVAFNDIVLTPEDIQNYLTKLPSLPAPASKQKKTYESKSKVPIALSQMRSTPKSDPKRKLPKTYVIRNYPGHPDDVGYQDEAIDYKAARPQPELAPDPEVGHTPEDKAYLKAITTGKATDSLKWMQLIQEEAQKPRPGINTYQYVEPLPGDRIELLMLQPLDHAGYPYPHLRSFTPPQQVPNPDSHWADMPRPEVPDTFTLAKYTQKDVLDQTPMSTMAVVSPDKVEFCCMANQQDKDCDHRVTPSTQNVLTQVPMTGVLTEKQFIACQRSDKDLAPLFEDLPSTYKLVNGVIHHVTRTTGATKPCIPTSLLRHQASMLHYSLFGIHRPSTTIFNTLKEKYYHSDMLSIIKEEIGTCMICTLCKRSNMPKPQPGAFKPLKDPRRAYTFDYAPNLSMTKAGNQHCLVVVDLASLLTRLIPLPSRSAKDLISAFKQIMIADATTITYLRSDGELAAQSDEFKQFCMEHSIIHEKTAKHAPQANGVAEVAVKGLKDALMCLARVMVNDWDEHLHYVCVSHAKVVAAHGLTPEQFHFGSEVPTPFTLVDNLEKPSLDAVKSLREQVFKRRMDAKAKTLARHKDRIDYRHKFEPGQQVLVLQSKTERKQPFACRYTGPYYITSMQEKSGTCTVKAVNSHHERKVQIVHLKLVPTAGRGPISETTVQDALQGSSQAPR